jgi:hypothetical protein
MDIAIKQKVGTIFSMATIVLYHIIQKKIDLKRGFIFSESITVDHIRALHYILP